MKKFCAIVSGGCSLLVASAASAAFTLASIRGPYIFDAAGTEVYAGDRFDVSGIGLVTFDGKGDYTGEETFTGTDGEGTTFVCSLSLTGRYQVNPDGTGTATTDFTTTSGICPNTTVTFSGVGTRDETDIESVTTGATDAAANGVANNINALVLHTRFIKQ